MLTSIRSVLFWCHLATGVVVGTVVLLMSVTGVLLTYERQLVTWSETHGLERAVPAGSRPLPIDSLLARARAESPATPSLVTWRAGAPRIVEVAIGNDDALYVDRYTGALLARADAPLRGFFARVTEWHRWLGARGGDREARARGRVVTGVANLGFLFLVLSGLLLWWPRNWTPAALRSVTLFRGGLRGKARDFNRHNVIGVWSVVPLAIVVGSGVVMSYPWANGLLFRAFGERPPASGTPAPARQTGRGGPEGTPAVSPALPATVDAMRERAALQSPDWRSISLIVPRDARGPVAFAIDRGTGGQPQKRGTLAFDRATGAPIHWEPFAAQSRARRARAILRFAHSGEVLGLAGQTLAGVVTLGATLMVWTGLSLALRRLAGWRRRRRRDREGSLSTATAGSE
jgi:uncharacterized iron-regulated membrane protein